MRISLRRTSSSLCSVAFVTVAPPTNTGSSRATGVIAPVRPTCTSIATQFGQRFLRREFMRQRKARRARHEAERVLLVAPVDLVDHAVDVVRQVLALLADAVKEAQQALRALHHRPFAVHRQAEFLVPVEQFAVRGRHLHAFEHADSVSEKRQRPVRGDLRIELPQTARRGVARIGEFPLFRGALAFVQTLEIALEHQHFAAHVEHVRHAFALELERNGADRADVLGDVLAGRAVAARGGLHERAVDVTQRDGEAIEFQFGRVVDRHRRLACVLAERVADALVERDDVFIGETVVQRQHGLVVHDRLEAARRLAAHALGGRIRHDQVRMLRLDALQFLEQLVVFRVRQVRLVEHVVRVVGAFEFRAQPRGTLCRGVGCGM